MENIIFIGCSFFVAWVFGHVTNFFLEKIMPDQPAEKPGQLKNFQNSQISQISLPKNSSDGILSTQASSRTVESVKLNAPPTGRRVVSNSLTVKRS